MEDNFRVSMDLIRFRILASVALR